MDISAPFNFMARHIANTAVNILQFFGLDVKLDHNLIRYADGNGVRIVWACTGLKQMYIFFCIIVFTSGKWKNKLWYVPAGLVVVHLFNLMRITVITAIVESHFEWFEFLHERLFKYLFYGVIFLMWMLWDEKIVRRQK